MADGEALAHGGGRAQRTWRPRLRAGPVGAVLLLAIALPCFAALPWSVHRYNDQRLAGERDMTRLAPSWSEPMGTDSHGRSMLWRCLMGGAISLGVGISAALIAVTIGVTWGALAGYIGGRVDSAMMRIVDVLYGLPYILMVVILGLALQPVFERAFEWLCGFWMRPVRATSVGASIAGIVTLLVAIGGVGWLTMARVIRGQVLSLRAQPFIESARAVGAGPIRILRKHLLPNLIGPIVVYTTLAVPEAILQESLLSFLGIGVRPPMPSWGNLAAEGVKQLPNLSMGIAFVDWWLLLFPCLLLGITLMALNFLGDTLRATLDPKSHAS